MLRCLTLVALIAVCLPAQATLESTKSVDAAPRSERIKVPSEAIDSSISAVVHLPAGYDQSSKMRYSVIYFLHGAGRGNEGTWAQRGTVETMTKLIKQKKLPPCIVVCPRSQRMSFWINWKDQPKQRHADFVTKELVAHIDEKYRTIADRSGRALMGDSMGGFGALINALKNPQIYGSVSAHEPAIYDEDRSKLPSWLTRGRRGGLLSRVFGTPIDEDYWKAHNVFNIVTSAKPDAFNTLPIWYDVGKDDRYGLAAPCSAWSKLLKKKKIKHTFNLREGGHGREFFRDNVPASLTWHGKFLSKPRLASKDVKPSK